MLFAGIDSGSRTIKIVLLDGAGNGPLAAECVDQGPQPGRQTEEFYDRVLAGRGLTRSDVARAVATGYARNNVAAAHATVTEITCHAVGVHHVAPAARTVIEIGGQDSKVLRLRPDGSVQDFQMNDRCAAGTGRFLEMMASRLACPLDGLGSLASRSTRPAAISSMCAVFAETEIIGLLASDCAEADIVAGVQAAVASRIAAMVGRNVAAPVFFTGGVATIAGMAGALAAAIGQPVAVAPQPRFTGALGAALLASRATV